MDASTALKVFVVKFNGCSGFPSDVRRDARVDYGGRLDPACRNAGGTASSSPLAGEMTTTAMSSASPGPYEIWQIASVCEDQPDIVKRRPAIVAVVEEVLRALGAIRWRQQDDIVSPVSFGAVSK